jgi:glycosyltransferase involved in cell wall biosynthesis
MRLPRLIKKFFRKATPTQPEKVSFVSERLPELGEGPIRFGPVKLLSTDPPIFLSGIPYDEYVGVARAFGNRYGNVKAGFIIFPTWTIEAPDKARSLRQAFLHHTQLYPEHRFRYICNTIEEASVLESVGQPALFLNHKFTVSEQVFRPLPDVPVEFDAIYNARFVAEKRHDLAADIDSVAYLAYSEPQEIRQNEFRKLWAETKVRCPNHALLNVIDDDGLPISQSHQDVNIALARAATGLILSEAEGASYAAMEYMLAGLPVVSTPSIGGRHVYFDPEYTIICEPDPRSVREAVGALKERNISRDYIREKTLQKIKPERHRFQALIDDLAAELGGKRSGVDAWPFAATSGVPWGSFNHHLKEFERTQAELFEKRFDLRQGAF